MTNILLTCVLALLCGGAIAAWLAYRKIKRTAEYLRDEVIAYITPEAPGKPSQLALFLDVAAASMGRAAAMSIKATFMGKQSGEARAELAAVGAEQEAEMQQAGLPGLLAGALGRNLRKKPGLFDLALPLVQSLMHNRGNGNHSTGPASSGGSPRFRFGG